MTAAELGELYGREKKAAALAIAILRAKPDLTRVRDELYDLLAAPYVRADALRATRLERASDETWLRVAELLGEEA